jgi:hypothetical protein
MRMPAISSSARLRLPAPPDPSAWCRTVRPESLLRVLQYDPHSPSEARVNVPLRNLPPFSEAFQCARASPPEEFQGCVVW